MGAPMRHSSMTGSYRKVPPMLVYTSPAASTAPPFGGGGQRPATTLPLNLVAHIVSYLDDVGDIARVTRSCRLLYYMTLPQLYRRVTLHSYGEMRYVNGRPEGFGSGSPFMMGLNGLTTRGHAALVEEFRLWGKWQETGVEDFAKGRIPDSSMMLNIILRAATDKMTKLKSFCWELECKPLKTLYLGLASHTNLTSLTLKFPSVRVPRPSVLVPAMTNLRVFKALDIDPLCYPDDISLLMLQSKKLEDVRLHFSPRMRAEAESIINFNTYFGRCHKANYRLNIKHFALQNWFGPNVLGLDAIFDPDVCKSVTFLDSFVGNDPRTVFVDDTWKDVPPDLAVTFERVRCNELSLQHIKVIQNAKVGLKYVYLPSNAHRQRTGFTPSSNGNSASPHTPSVETTPLTPYDPLKDADWVALGKEYLHVLGRKHGATLKHLLLSDSWAVTQEDFADLINHCPQLEQLGIAVDSADHTAFRLLTPSLVNLRCLRILDNEYLRQHFAQWTHEQRMWVMSREMGKRPPRHLEFICLADFCYKIGGPTEILLEDGSVEAGREITLVDKSEAMKYEIWHLDVVDLTVDPIAPFTK